MTLNSTGLSIGAILPSSNLHVNGNAIISEQLFVGGSSGSSNLNVNGTLGFEIQALSSNATLGDATLVLVDSSSDNITLTLPYAANVTGRVFEIKKTSLANDVVVRGGGNLIDLAINYELTSGNLGYIRVVSYDGKWHVITDTQSSVTAWSPLEASPSLWLDASEASSITAGGAGNVSQWRDISGNDYHVSQSATVDQPTTGTTTLNGLNVLDWGTAVNAKSLDRDGDDTQNWQDVYVVARYDGGSTFPDFYGLFTGYNNYDNADNPIDHRGIGLIADTGGVQQQWYDNAKWWTDTYLNGSVLNSPYTVLGVSPTAEDPFIASISTATTLNSIDGVCIGNDRNNAGPNRGWRGIICEVIAFNTKLSDENRQKVEGYLAHKWGLVSDLPPSHPYKP